MSNLVAWLLPIESDWYKTKTMNCGYLKRDQTELTGQNETEGNFLTKEEMDRKWYSAPGIFGNPSTPKEQE